MTELLTKLVSVLEIQGKFIHKLQVNVTSLTEQVTQQVGYIDGLKIIMRPETDAGSDVADLRARVTALEQEETFNPETIADLVWEEIESKVNDAATEAADYAFDHLDAADVVRRGLKEIL
jgi:hypothetical protein